ncbi:MAG: DNA polymerase III subunit delta' C-terminal domain-containing protein [Clostridium sp.]|uniref:DNA polymerase III subunit n=1 Tax=Clostridium sp. TaxID=1506 RepID=UPI002FC715DC
MFGIVGQDKVIELFNSSLKGNRIAHSYLIEGDRGLGKKNVAFYIAASLLCRSEDVGPCGDCSVCRRIREGNHPDVKIVLEDTVKIDNIRLSIEEVYKKPYEGDRKVLIIDNFHTTTIEGQNAILKTLEEPPAASTIILLASTTLTILDTIKSRCQIIKLFRQDVSLIKEKLIEEGYSEDESVFASLYSEGNYGEALKACSVEFNSLRSEVLEIGLNLFKVSKFEAMEIASGFTKYKDNIDNVLGILTSLYRDIIILKIDQSSENIINRDNFQILVEESYRLSYNRLDKALRVITDTRKRLIRDTNFQLTMEVMILGIQEAK